MSTESSTTSLAEKVPQHKGTDYFLAYPEAERDDFLLSCFQITNNIKRYKQLYIQFDF